MLESGNSIKSSANVVGSEMYAKIDYAHAAILEMHIVDRK